MIVIIETFILCVVFFLLCYLGTGTENINKPRPVCHSFKPRAKLKSLSA